VKKIRVWGSRKPSFRLDYSVQAPTLNSDQTPGALPGQYISKPYYFRAKTSDVQSSRPRRLRNGVPQ